MARKEKQIRFAYLTDHSIDEIVDAHVNYVSSPRYEWDEEWEKIDDGDATQKKFPTWQPSLHVVEEGESAPRKAPLRPKYMFLLHVIIMRCRNRKGACRLDYAFFTDLIGKSFGKMLHNLSLMGIIYLSDTFEIGKESRLIELRDWNIGFYDNIDNRIIRNYLSKLEDDKKKKDKERKEEIIKILGKDFYDCYSNNLSQLDLVRRNEAVEYVNSREYKSPIQEHFYKSSIENFNKDNLRITSVDDRGRIYHYLTNCPRVLRRYFNVKFDVDIANSQPLLFCNFLIERYNIDYEIIEVIRRIDVSLFNNSIQDNNFIYNKGKQLCKLLKESDLQVQNLNVIPSDVLLYLYSCMKGLFWDDFVTTFAELERGEVKENLFREVFYSHSRTMRHKEYGKVFAEVYPSVWRLIREMKKDAELLCNRITKVESEIFHAILGHCFERNWVVTSVHDAIYVLDVPGNEGIDEGELIEIIMSEYCKHRLIPTVHLERTARRRSVLQPSRTRI